MQKIDIIFKSITLLYRESFLDTSSDSKDLVRMVLRTITTNNKYSMLGGNNEMVGNLKKFVMELCDSTDQPIDKDILIQSISLIIPKDSGLLEVLTKTLIDDLEVDKAKRAVLALKRFLTNYHKETEINNILSNASYRFKNNRSGINSTNDFINNLVTSLEALELSSKAKDPAIANEIDLGNQKSLSDILDVVKDEEEFGGKLKTGWQAMNIMTSGGFKRGESVMLASLQHKYKSGLTDSLFMQIAMNNIPQMLDATKKPLLVLVSLEDDMTNVTDFMYRYLYFNEHKKIPKFNEISSDDASRYIQEKLGINGYHIKMLRVDPTAWTYKHLFNKLIDYEAEGYEIHALFTDYLAMIPTIGCVTTGAMGTDIRDLFRRVRNFCSARKITFFTPHQLSVDAKLLIRNGVPDATFVKELVGKGFFSGTKQLDQELDLIMYGHIAKINGKACLTVARDKHRTPVILDDKYKYWYIPFPDKAPIPEDINDEKMLAVFPDANGPEENSFDF